MKYHKRLGSIWLIYHIISGMLYTSGLVVFAQETGSADSSSTVTETEIKRFLDNNYKRLSEAKDFLEQEAQTHRHVNDKNKCSTCHEVIQTSGSDASYIIFRENYAALLTANCLKCHQQNIGDHPILIKASFPVPKDFPLSDKKEITCVTCHNPHFQRFSNRPWYPRTFKTIVADYVKRKKVHKTFFLRRNNAEKELCLSCHKGISRKRKY